MSSHIISVTGSRKLWPDIVPFCYPGHWGDIKQLIIKPNGDDIQYTELCMNNQPFYYLQLVPNHYFSTKTYCDHSFDSF